MANDSEKSVMLFGRDVSKIPCFRSSLLYGILGGLGCGLVRFMFTSRPKSGADFAVGSFVFITMAYWFPCRYQYSKKRFEMLQLHQQLQNHILSEGVEPIQPPDVPDNVEVANV